MTINSKRWTNTLPHRNINLSADAHNINASKWIENINTNKYENNSTLNNIKVVPKALWLNKTVLFFHNNGIRKYSGACY